jgi:hypothetical protein
MRKLLMNKKAATQISAAMIVLMLLFSVGAIAAFVLFEDDIRGFLGGEEPPAGTYIDPSTGEPTTPIVPPTSIRVGTVKWAVETVTSHSAGVAGDTAYLGIAVADQNGYFNPMDFLERSELAAVPEETTNFLSAGDEVLFVVSSDDDASGCNETYSSWFYVENLDHGAYVKRLPKRNPISALTEYTDATGDYVYKVDGSKCEIGAQRVNWDESGSGNYWQLGTFTIYERLADENTIVQTISAGVVGATYNDGATFEDADGDINANWTFTGDSQSIYLQLIGEDDNGAWGIPTMAVTSSGQIKQYQGVILFATDAIGMSDIQSIYDDGWKQMTKPGLTDDIAFYYVVDPFSEGCVPDYGDTLDLSVEITITDTGLSSATEYEIEVWFLDWQNVQDVAQGSTTATVPSGYGMCYEVGADAVSQPVAMTLSSGSTATPALMGHFTTN